MDIPKSYLAKLVVAIIPVLFLSGCWDRRELNTLALVSGVGLDVASTPNRIVLTLQIIRPGEIKQPGAGAGGGGGGAASRSATRVGSSTGETVDQAIKNFITQTSRCVYFPHSQIIVIGKEAAKRGIYPLLDFFIRNPQPRPTSLVIIAAGRAGDVLLCEDGIEKIGAFGIARSIKAAAENSFTPAVTLQELTERLMSKTAAPIAPLVEIYEEKESTGKKMKRVRVKGTAVFKGDKLVGELGLKETRGLMWVLGKVKDGVITVPSHDGDQSLEIRHARSKVKAELKENRLLVRVEIAVESMLGDQKNSKNLASPSGISSLERMQANFVRSDVLAALASSRELNADIFCFGEEFHGKYPGIWPELEARWDELYKNIDVIVNVRSHVCDTGV
ncbi:MAG: Ger(x)C family spore germination protein, partial [Thermacetogeniaceae bacterium]